MASFELLLHLVEWKSANMVSFPINALLTWPVSWGSCPCPGGFAVMPNSEQRSVEFPNLGVFYFPRPCFNFFHNHLFDLSAVLLGPHDAFYSLTFSNKTLTPVWNTWIDAEVKLNTWGPCSLISEFSSVRGKQKILFLGLQVSFPHHSLLWDSISCKFIVVVIMNHSDNLKNYHCNSKDTNNEVHFVAEKMLSSILVYWNWSHIHVLKLDQFSISEMGQGLLLEKLTAVLSVN